METACPQAVKEMRCAFYSARGRADSNATEKRGTRDRFLRSRRDGRLNGDGLPSGREGNEMRILLGTRACRLQCYRKARNARSFPTVAARRKIKWRRPALRP